MATVTCPTCSAVVEPVTPRGPAVVTTSMWVCALLLTVAASMPLLGLAVLPLWFFALWGVGAAASRHSTAVCRVCRHQITRPAVEPQPPELSGPVVPQPA
jgi:hypothetical protein